MPDLKSFFSYKGRLGRLQYFLRQGAICIIFSLLGYSLEPPEGMFVSAFVQNILISLLMIARFHDLDKPGYYTFCLRYDNHGLNFQWLHKYNGRPLLSYCLRHTNIYPICSWNSWAKLLWQSTINHKS